MPNYTECINGENFWDWKQKATEVEFPDEVLPSWKMIGFFLSGLSTLYHCYEAQNGDRFFSKQNMC